jgi:hypothetical protein
LLTKSIDCKSGSGKGQGIMRLGLEVRPVSRGGVAPTRSPTRIGPLIRSGLRPGKQR